MYSIVITILLFTFVFDIVLKILNYSYKNKPIPLEVIDVYEEKEYNNWLNYNMENFRLSLVSDTIRILLFLLLLLLGFFPYLSDFTLEITQSIYLQTLLFLGIYECFDFVLDLFISYYNQFSIEERYGFNKTTLKTFILDKIKSLLLTIILGGGFILLLTYLFYHVGDMFYLYSLVSIILIALFINLFYVKLFIPLFNKLSPLEEGELNDKIVEFASSVGYEVNKISIIDASKRSTKLNAFFTGFGRLKQVVLYDNLLNKMTNEQILSILAHEIGHSKKKHILKNLMIMIINISIYLFILLFTLKSDKLSIAFGFEEVHFGFGLILFTILVTPISIVIGFFLNVLSRKNEYQADHFAKEHGFGKELEESLKILAKENYANLTPHPLYVAIKYSHPPIAFRIKKLRRGD